MFALPSVEQSSQMIISQSLKVCAMTLSRVSRRVEAPLRTFTITLTRGITFRRLHHTDLGWLCGVLMQRRKKAIKQQLPKCHCKSDDSEVQHEPIPMVDGAGHDADEQPPAQ